MEHLINLLLGPAGTLVLSLTFLFAGYKKWLVPGWAYKDKEAEALFWREAALKATHTAERAVGVTADKVGI